MNSARQVAKSLAFALCTLVCGPVLLWFWTVGSLAGKDRTLEGISQLLAMLPGHSGAVIRAAFYSRVLAECHPNVFVGFGSLLTKVDTRLGSHGDRSIDGPGQFIQTNIVGTFHLLQASLGYYRSLNAEQASQFRFLHVSTDEVFGSLGPTGYFCETTAYDPRSPYSSSKAASDHLVRAWSARRG